MLDKKTSNLLIAFLLSFSFSLLSCSSQITAESLTKRIENKAISLNTPDDLDTLINNAADSRLVLLGESTHGTKEFYEWRSIISKRLIEEKGFDFIVVEGDWKPFWEVNSYIKGLSDYKGNTNKLLKKSFQRWPEWMWSNKIIADLTEWLRDYNISNPEKPIGFYGMDVYGQWDSLEALKNYIRASGSDSLIKLKSNYDCFAPYKYDEWAYSSAVWHSGFSCESEVKEVVNFFKKNKHILSEDNKYEYLSAKQNAIVLKNAELFYRTSLEPGSKGWNSRVLHMNDTINRLLDYYGEGSKGIIWAHNTHVGDARATYMKINNEINIGQLLREQYGKENVYIVGFGTHRGRVRAGSQWGSRGQSMKIPHGREGSGEYLFNQVSYPSFIIHFRGLDIPEMNNFIPHRAIGVVYNPESDIKNYIPTVFSLRYDSFIFIDQTKALDSL
jgi:erythromycin esterase-like protein